MITIHLKIKFRAFFVTLMTLDRNFQVQLPVQVPPIQEAVLFNERGVFLSVKS